MERGDERTPAHDGVRSGLYIKYCGFSFAQEGINEKYSEDEEKLEVE